MAEWGATKPNPGTPLRTDGLYPWALDSLVGCWPMWEGSGTTAEDVSGYNHNALLYGNPVWQDDGIEFDGDDDYADTGNPIFADSDDFTVLIAATPRLSSSWYVLRGEDEDAGGWSADLGSLGAHVVTTVPVTAQIDTMLETGQAQNERRLLAMTFEQGVRIAYYANNEVSSTDTASTLLRSSSTGYRFGITNGNRHQTCHIEFVYIWRKVLTPEQIAEIFAAPYLLFEPNKPAHVTLDPDNESVIGLVREVVYGVTPTTGYDPDKTIANIVFFPCRYEGIQGDISSSPQKDDMTTTRGTWRAVNDASSVRGALRMLAGTESLGYFLTSMFGSPATTQLAASSIDGDAVYQHVWYPGQNARGQWPVTYSIESQFDSIRSKLVQGAVMSKIALFIGNNAAVIQTVEVLGKKIAWLYPDSDDAHGSGTEDERGNVRPAIMTATAPVISEDAWHFTQMVAYPQLAGADEQKVLSFQCEPQFMRLNGVFTGGSGANIATFFADNFKMQGRATILFESGDLWQMFERGLLFDASLILRANALQGEYYEQLGIEVFGCKALQNSVVNKTGDLTYDFGWGAQATDMSCRFTIINTVSNY